MRQVAKMNKITNNNQVIFVGVMSVLVTISFTPFWNEDSLIIPKLILLFTSALYILPQVFFELTKIKEAKNSYFLKISYAITFIMLIQILLVLVFTSSPFEQQFYGGFGRGLGIATEISLLIYFLIIAKNITANGITFIIYALVISCFISSIYSILQFFGLDFYEWQSQTNGIIGTLGNPNFQSSFAAMALVPVLSLFNLVRVNRIIVFSLCTIFVFTIYICRSTQGYIAALISVGTYSLIYFWYKRKVVFVFLLSVMFFSLITIIMGMTNHGPLANLLYKYSVKSRGEMLRNSIRLIKDHLIFGVGFDSLGDYYLKYKDLKTSLGVNEFTDHAHNLYVNYAAVAGVPYAFLHLILAVLVLFAFINILRFESRFNARISSLFCAWVCFQAQALISPSNITMLVWNFVISGVLVGIAADNRNAHQVRDYQKIKTKLNLSLISWPLLILALTIMVPYFNVDKKSQDALSIGSAELAMKASNEYPRSVKRFSRLTEGLLKSNLPKEALDVARRTIEFNPQNPSGWGFILVNPVAPKSERIEAQQVLMKLDPQNETIKNFKIPE